MPWSTLFNRRVVFDAIEMTDWRMFVEQFARRPDTAFRGFAPRPPRGPSALDDHAALRARAHRGEFTYEDHGTPWSVVTRNLDVTVGAPDERVPRPAQLLERHGARFRTTCRFAPT